MFNFLKKEPIDINVTTSSKYYSENIEEFICQTKFPSWIKDIHTPSIKEVFDNMWYHKRPPLTIKTCPAFIDILKNSFSLFSPCDILIEIDKKTKSWKAVTRTNAISLTEHNLLQQMGSSNIFSGKGIHCKIEWPFQFKSSKPINLIFMQPMYHTLSDLTIIPGSVELSRKIGLIVNLNTFISNQHIEYGAKSEDTKMIHIKKGDILAYLYYGKNTKIGNISASYVSAQEFPSLIERFNLNSHWVKTNRE